MVIQSHYNVRSFPFSSWFDISHTLCELTCNFWCRKYHSRKDAVILEGLQLENSFHMLWWEIIFVVLVCIKYTCLCVSFIFYIINEISPPKKFKSTKEEKKVGKILSKNIAFKADIKVIFNCSINFVSPVSLLSTQYIIFLQWNLTCYALIIFEIQPPNVLIILKYVNIHM